jgi:hypothetical protein
MRIREGDIRRIVRRVILEADAQGADPAEPSYWDEVEKTAGRFGRAAVDAAGTLVGLTLGALAGQAHAPRDEEDVRKGIASRVTLLTLLPDMITHIAMLQFRIAAKITDTMGQGGLVVARVGEEEAKVLLEGSMLHDLLVAGSFAPGVGYVSAILDGVVYSAEGEIERAAECFALAGIMGVMEGRALKAARKSGTIPVDTMRNSYSDVPVFMRDVGEIPLTSKDIADVSAFVDRQAAVLSGAGMKNAPEVASKAKSFIKGGKFMFRAPPDNARFLEANKAGRLLINGGVEGRTLTVLKDSAEYVDELRRLAKSNTDSPIPMNRKLSYSGESRPETLPEREYTRDFYSSQYSKDTPHPRVGELPPRPPPMNPLIHGVGSHDLMTAWKKVASKYPAFWQGVKTVHWTGFGSQDFGGAAKAAVRFLDDASPHAELSTVGYTKDMIAAGGGGHKIFPIGIQVEGEITLAAAGDAGTTNPRLSGPATKFKKMPQVGFERMSVGGEEITLPRIARGQSSHHASFGSESKLMVGPTSWREPYVGGTNHNELIVGGEKGWRPKAIVIDPTDELLRSASTWPEEIKNLFDAARRHNIPVVDPKGRAVSPSLVASGVRAEVIRDIKRLEAEIFKYESQISRIKPGETSFDDGFGGVSRRSLMGQADVSRERLISKQKALSDLHKL